MSEYGDGFGKTGMTVRRADGTFEVQVMSETFIFNRWLTFERHSKVCTCSWCNPWSLGFKEASASQWVWHRSSVADEPLALDTFSSASRWMDLLLEVRNADIPQRLAVLSR